MAIDPQHPDLNAQYHLNLEETPWEQRRHEYEEKQRDYEAALRGLEPQREELVGLHTELAESCPHPEVEIDESYFSGSYLDRETWTTTTRCAFCKKVLDEQTERGGYG